MLNQEKLKTIIIYVITLIVLIVIILFIGIENIIDNLFKLGLSGIIILVILYILDLLIRTYRWKILLVAQGVNLPIKSLFMPIVMALAINLFTPARAGETIRLIILKRNYNTNYSDTLSSIAIEQILSILGLICIVTISLFFVSSSFQSDESSIIIQQLVLVLFLVSVCTLLVLVLIIIKPKLIYRILQNFPPFIEEKLTSIFNAFLAGINDLRSKPIFLINGIVTSAIIWVIEGMMIYGIILTVFPPVNLIDLPWAIAASCAGNITFIVPILPGAMGEYEAILGIVLTNSPNYPNEGAVSVAFIDRIVKSVVLGLLGVYATIRLGGMELLELRKDFYPKIEETHEKGE